MQEARRDSLRRVYKRYPRMTDLSVGVNLVESLFMAFGQSYASADVSATLNIWNRLQPTVELGLGWAKSRPDDMNFIYNGKPSPTSRWAPTITSCSRAVPTTRAYIGIRLGYSTFSYDVTDVNYHNGYWQEDIAYQLKGERSHALWGEAGVGLKVKLFDRLSMGWMIRYHGIFNYGKSSHSKPWFIPGYGPRSRFTGTLLGLQATPCRFTEILSGTDAGTEQHLNTLTTHDVRSLSTVHDAEPSSPSLVPPFRLGMVQTLLCQLATQAQQSFKIKR